MLRKWVIILLGCLMPFTVTGQEADADIHAELRTLLGGMQSAVNDAKYGELGQYFHDQMRVTMINQEVLKARGEIAPFFDKWFGPSRFMKRVNMTLTADALTQLHSSKTLGID